MSYRHVFGPVISGRLGRSLGLDVLALERGGAKVCSFDCLYCEVGPNPERRVERGRHAPPGDVLEEFADWLRRHAPPGENIPLDHVTFGGSGEPCLHSDLGELITKVRELAPGVPVAVLTNSSLLPDAQTRRELALADVVLPSLDSLVPEEFQRVNRPHPAVRIEDVAAALLEFRREFSGRLYLEVLLCAGVNDSEENLARLTDYVPRLRPERVDVVTLSRPGAYAKARAVDADTLARFRRALEPLAANGGHAQAVPATPDVVALRQAAPREDDEAGLEQEIYQSLRRRPQTSAQLAEALETPLAEIEKALARLHRAHRLMALGAASRGETVYYKAL